MLLGVSKRTRSENDIDVTPFMNLMVVLIPVLLLSMSFTQIVAIELKLPELTGGQSVSLTPQSQLEIVVDEKGYQVFFPDRTLLKTIPKKQQKNQLNDQAISNNEQYDLMTLSQVLQAVKQKVPEKRTALVRSAPTVQFQQVVDVLQATKFYTTVVAASVVDIELFPEVSLDET